VKLRHHIFIILFMVITFQVYSGGSSDTSASSVDSLEITARGAIGRLEAATTGPLWTGDGGKNIRLAILAPEVQGEVPGYLPIYIQGLLNNNFGKFSAVNLIDRQNLDKIISEQNIAGSGRFSDRDFVRIGNLANAQFFLFGTIQKLSGNRFSLQLSVTEAISGVRKATFMKEGTLSQLEGRAALINEATAELLTQLGVQLTEAGRRELIAGNISTVQAQTGLAKGITAQAGGSEVAALFNFTQAITFDPSQMEALSRLSTLSTTISGGTISERITNDIQARDRWVEAFKETTRFFNNHPPFEIIFDPNLMQIGETDYAKRTATLGMRIALDPSKAGFDALNALLEGLEKTGRRSAWGFSGWPLMDISPSVSGTVVFGGKRSFSYKVDVALLNENGKRIGSGSVTLKTEPFNFSSGDKNVSSPFSAHDIVRFSNIKAEDLTSTLTIVIVAVNGISSSNFAASGFMRIVTADLEKRAREHETFLLAAQRQRELEIQQSQESGSNNRIFDPGINWGIVLTGGIAPYTSFLNENMTTHVIGTGILLELELLKFFSFETIIAFCISGEDVFLPVIPLMSKFGYKFEYFDISLDVGYTLLAGFTIGGTLGLNFSNGTFVIQLFTVPWATPPSFANFNSAYMGLIGFKFHVW